MKTDMWLALMALVLPYLVPPEQFQKWMLRPVFALHERGRQKKRARLEARKAFLTKLHDSAMEQSQYLLQGVLIILAALAAAVVLGLQMWMTWPHGMVGFTWIGALSLYFFALYRLGVHRRVRTPASFEKAMQQIDAQIVALQTDDARTVDDQPGSSTGRW
jgi:Flp pilus assembly protein TadB